MKLSSITPFVELVDPMAMRPDGRTNREYIRDGIRNLVGVFDEIVVVTTPGKIGDVYEYLKKACPGIRIVGGLKPANYIGVYIDTEEEPISWRFESDEQWSEVVKFADRIAEATGINRCVLELERALRAYHEGKVLIDPSKMEDALRPIRESSIQCYFYFPSPVPNSVSVPNRLAMTTELTAAVARAIKPTDGFMAGYQRTPAGNTWRFGDLMYHRSFKNRDGHDLDGKVAEMLVVHTSGRMDDKPVYMPMQIVQQCSYWSDSPIVIQCTADDFGALAAQFREIVPVTEEPQTEESTGMAINANRIAAKHALNFRKMVISQPVSAAPPYIELGAVTWANATNGGGGEPRYMRQEGNRCICRVKLPISSVPYWIIPEIGLGSLHGSHALEGLNGHEIQAMGAAWNEEELGTLTIKKRCIVEPRLIQPIETDVWIDYSVPMLGEMGPDNVFVVNLHPYMIL